MARNRPYDALRGVLKGEAQAELVNSRIDEDQSLLLA